MIGPILLLLLFSFATAGWGYPLDAAQQTGIARLEGLRLVQQGQVPGRKLPPGALFSSEQIRLLLAAQPPLELPEVDVPLSEKIIALLGEEHIAYNFSLLDLSDPQQPAYAEYQAEKNFNPGSLGKILIALGVFQALADRYPDDLEARRELLRSRLLLADKFIRSDEHKVPFWDAERQRLPYRKIVEGDTANLWSWLDWMLSASSNAAAAMVLREYLLMLRFADRYPVDSPTAEKFFRLTGKKELMQLLIRGLHEPMQRNGLDPQKLRQGGFFTWKGKQLVPGGSSRAETRSLINLLLKLEQGLLVDQFSSLELKKLLYMSEKRIRYASAPALKNAAVFFKSGSLYSCQPEEGFVCKKYQGNKRNLLNSVAIVEEGQAEVPLHYLVVISSNVLKLNSAVAHQTLATRIRRLLLAKHRQRLKTRGSAE